MDKPKSYPVELITFLCVVVFLLWTVVVSGISSVLSYQVGYQEGFEVPTDDTYRVYDLYDWEAVTQCIEDGEKEEAAFGTYDQNLAPTCMTLNLNR